MCFSIVQSTFDRFQSLLLPRRGLFRSQLCKFCTVSLLCIRLSSLCKQLSSSSADHRTLAQDQSVGDESRFPWQTCGNATFAVVLAKPSKAKEDRGDLKTESRQTSEDSISEGRKECRIILQNMKVPEVSLPILVKMKGEKGSCSSSPTA